MQNIGIEQKSCSSSEIYQRIKSVMTVGRINNQCRIVKLCILKSKVSVLKGKGCRNLFIDMRICFRTERKNFGRIQEFNKTIYKCKRGGND